MNVQHLTPIVLGMLVLAGCLSHAPDAAPEQAERTQSAADAGARTGAAPAAPSEPYEVKVPAADPGSDPVVAKAFPLKMRTNAAKPPVHKEIKGMYNMTECSQFGNLNPMRSGWRMNGLSELLDAGDVYTYALNLTFTNADSSWGDLHVYYQLGSKFDYWQTSAADKRGLVAENFSGQGYRLHADDAAWVAVACWYGQITTPLEYTITLDLTFAQDAVPAEAPILFTVPAGATQLFVTGVPYDASQGVLAHFRVFDQQDKLLCECALSPLAQASAVKLTGSGDYVILVDHTTAGFVALALDAPPTDSLRPLDIVWRSQKLFESASDTSLDKTVEVTFPTVPLALGGWVEPPGTDGAGLAAGKGYSMQITNARGTPLVQKMAAFAVYRIQTPLTSTWNMMGIPFVPGDWAYATDHHAYTQGLQTVHVKADMLHGDPIVGYTTYERQ